MSVFTPYLPVDRFLSIVDNASLPEFCYGAALFADISGFTPLTEQLALELGPRRGAEELTQHLNAAYEALITPVHQHGGSVIYFSGDAITCWFEEIAEKNSALSAVTAAWQMQQALNKVGEITTPHGSQIKLKLKVAVSAGTARRFLVGNPSIQVLDVLAGSTLYRLAEGEHFAEKGDIIVAPEVAVILRDVLEISEWRGEGTPEPDNSFGVIGNLKSFATPDPWRDIPELAAPQDFSTPLIDDEQLTAWIPGPIYQRLKAGLSDFLTELRPTVAVFIRFSGIDYDQDLEAGTKLDTYIRWLQSILAEYEGYLTDITIGDKGSYLYVAFGAPMAHQNDAERAVRTALAIISAPPPELNWLKDVQVGISRGTMRTGVVGSKARHIYGVIGDEVNLAARLMGAAKPGQVLVSSKVYDVVKNLFEWEALPPLKVKGKAEPVNVYHLLGNKVLEDSVFQALFRNSLPLVGRKHEVEIFQDKLDKVLQNQGQILAITADAGMGKSRLIAEFVQKAAERKLEIYLGECQSYGTNNSYLVWQNIWRNFFNLNAKLDTKIDLLPLENQEEQIRSLEQQLNQIDPALVPRMPLLKDVLNLPIPDNELTSTIDAKLRKASREGLLVDCIRARSRNNPIMLVLEDGQWLDPLSHDLLENIGRGITDCQVLIVVAFRPPELEYLQAPRITSLPITTVVELNELSPEDTNQFIEQKMVQIGFESKQPTEDFIKAITERAQGNPFFIEELLIYLRDLGLDPDDPQSLSQMELPTSLHSLILSRIDQLSSESLKITLKVASIIGRVFSLNWLSEVHPYSGNTVSLINDLTILNRLELTSQDQPEPDLAYIFNHIVIREVAYESLSYATRSALHGQLGHFIEKWCYPDKIGQYVDLLAYHFYLSPDEERKRHYLRLAGEAAQAAYANNAAIDYFQRLLPLLPEVEQIWVKLKLGQVLELVTQWNEAEALYREALSLAKTHNQREAEAQIQNTIGNYLLKQKRYAEAEPVLLETLAAFEELGDLAGKSRVITEIGEVYRLQGKYSQAREYYNQSLEIAAQVENTRQRQAVRAISLKAAGTASNQQGDPASARKLYEESLSLLREIGDKPGIASLLNNLGVVARHSGDYAEARRLTEDSMQQFRELGDRWAVSVLLNNLGLLARDQGDKVAARSFLEESLSVRRLLGDKWGTANVLSSLGDVLIDQGDYVSARGILEESLTINNELNNQNSLAYVLEYIASVDAAEDFAENAAYLGGAAAAIREKIGIPLSQIELDLMERRLAQARLKLGDIRFNEMWEKGKTEPLEQVITSAFSPA